MPRAFRIGFSRGIRRSENDQVGEWAGTASWGIETRGQSLWRLDCKPIGRNHDHHSSGLYESIPLHLCTCDSGQESRVPAIPRGITQFCLKQPFQFYMASIPSPSQPSDLAAEEVEKISGHQKLHLMCQSRAPISLSMPAQLQSPWRLRLFVTSIKLT